MDILNVLQRILDATPEHQHLTAPIKRKVLVDAVAEIISLRALVATTDADAQARTGTNQNI